MARPWLEERQPHASRVTCLSAVHSGVLVLCERGVCRLDCQDNFSFSAYWIICHPADTASHAARFGWHPCAGACSKGGTGDV